MLPLCCFPRGAQASSTRAFPSLRSVVAPYSSRPAPHRRKLVLILTLFSYLVNTIKNRGIENNRSARNTERLFINIVTRGWGTPRVTLTKHSPSPLAHATFVVKVQNRQAARAGSLLSPTGRGRGKVFLSSLNDKTSSQSSSISSFHVYP